MFLFAATLHVVGAPSTFTRNVPSGPPACGQLSSNVRGVDASVPLPSPVAGLDASSGPAPELVPEPTALPEFPEPKTLPAELRPEPVPVPAPDDSPEPPAGLEPLAAPSGCPAFAAGASGPDPVPQLAPAKSTHTHADVVTEVMAAGNASQR